MPTICAHLLKQKQALTAFSIIGVTRWLREVLETVKDDINYAVMVRPGLENKQYKNSQNILRQTRESRF